MLGCANIRILQKAMNNSSGNDGCSECFAVSTGRFDALAWGRLTRIGAANVSTGCFAVSSARFGALAWGRLTGIGAASVRHLPLLWMSWRLYWFGKAW